MPEKRSALAFGLYLLLFSGSVALPLAMSGQDTVSVQDVEVRAAKLRIVTTGRKYETIDSALREQFRFQTLSELIALNSAVYVRTYGHGGIATNSLRGGSPEQTAVLWNGMNIQNTMLGQSDLSMIPHILFEAVAIEYGGSASVWGSGAVGGSIHLDNRSDRGKPRTTVASALGTLGQFNTAVIFSAGEKKVANTIKVYMSRSRNRFRFEDFGTNAVTTMSNAAFTTSGVMNEFKWYAHSKHVVTLNAWLSNAERQLPGPPPFMAGRRSQEDGSMRFQGNWNYAGRILSTRLRSGYFNDAIDYRDSILREYTHSRAENVMADLENTLAWNKTQQLLFGLSYMNTWARSDNYEGYTGLKRWSLLLGNRSGFFDRRLLVSVNGRAEYFSAGTLPVTGNAGLEWRPVRTLTVGLSAAAVYRQPTMNELYWRPGGNPSLRPEQGETMDGTIRFRWERKNVQVFVNVSAFTRSIRDWILWLPAPAGTTSPENVQHVWSRGGETRSGLDVQKNKWRYGAEVHTSYVVSTVEKTYLAASGSKGMQLIYTPLYSGNGNVHAGYGQTSLYAFVQYVGYRYITSDNSSWLEPYKIVSLRFTQAIDLPVMRIVFFASANNLLNENYHVMAGRPMPLSNYEFGLTLNIHSSKKPN